VTGLIERLLPSGDAGTAAAAGGVKLAALVAAGAAATSGGLVVAHETQMRHRAPAHAVTTAHRATPAAHARPAAPVAQAPAVVAAPIVPRVTPPKNARASPPRAVPHTEFAPHGGELTPGPSAAAHTTARRAATKASAPVPSTPSTPDTARGEFSPQP
jgi:hypothetical protein